MVPLRSADDCRDEQTCAIRRAGAKPGAERTIPCERPLESTARISHRLSVSADPPLGGKPRHVDDAGPPLISSSTSDIDIVVANIEAGVRSLLLAGRGPSGECLDIVSLSRAIGRRDQPRASQKRANRRARSPGERGLRLVADGVIRRGS